MRTIWLSGSHFRDQLIAASLKESNVSASSSAMRYFRDQLIAASLKEHRAGCIPSDRDISAIN